MQEPHKTTKSTKDNKEQINGNPPPEAPAPQVATEQYRLEWRIDNPPGSQTKLTERMRLSGWALTNSKEGVRLALRTLGRTKIQSPNENRPDVAKWAEKEFMDATRTTRCGFSIEIGQYPTLDVGFEIDGFIRWVRHYAR